MLQSFKTENLISEPRINVHILAKYIYFAETNHVCLLSNFIHAVEPMYVVWTPWDQSNVSLLSRCFDFPGQLM